jgi:hypothetical protein
LSLTADFQLQQQDQSREVNSGGAVATGAGEQYYCFSSALLCSPSTHQPTMFSQFGSALKHGAVRMPFLLSIPSPSIPTVVPKVSCLIHLSTISVTPQLNYTYSYPIYINDTSQYKHIQFQLVHE